VDVLTGVLIAILGLCAGVLSGMFGIGGAIISTPGVRALGTTPILAVGSTIPAIVPGAVSGAWRYAREGLVDWRIGLVCGASGTLFAVAGSWIADLVDARWLMVLTATLVGWSGWSIIRRSRAARGSAERVEVEEADPDGDAPRRRGPGAMEHRPADPALAGVGAVAGFVAGLLGVGGGVIMMPLFTSVLRIPVKTAVGSSLVAVAIFSVPAMVTHALLGHIDWAVALLLVAGTVVGAQIGARLTIRSAEATIEVLLGSFFLVIAAVYAGRELMGIF
jgi:uncharacterized membrane protein YfcA